MASVRKLKKDDPASPWICEYTDAGGKRRRYTPKTGLKKDADAFRRKIEGELERGEHVASAVTLTFAQAAKEWLVDCERKHKSVGSPARSTIMSYDCLLRTKLLPVFGRTKMTELRGEAVQDWLNDRAEVNAYDSLRQYRLIISLMVKFCIKTNRLKRNVLVEQQVRLPGEKKRIRIPSREEIARLLAALEQRGKGEQILSFLQRRAFVSLALFAGLRVGEICGLQWDFIDFDQQVLRIRHSYSSINGLKGPKTRAGTRDVPMVPVVAQSLRALQVYYGTPAGGFIFMTKAGVNMRQSYDNCIWRPVMRKAGLTEPERRRYTAGRALFRFHSLRHASVSLLISEGVNGLHVASFIGHANVNTTMGIYGHLFPEDTRVKTSLGDIVGQFGPTWEPPTPVNH